MHRKAPRVIIVAEEKNPQSVYWFDYTSHSKWPKWMILRRISHQEARRRPSAKLLLELREASLVITLHNTPFTRSILLLKRSRILRCDIVVMELNLKEENLKHLRKLAASWLYAAADTITVLAPSDRNLLSEELRLDISRIVILEQWAQPGSFQEQRPNLLNISQSFDNTPFAIAAGRSSRNFNDLFLALANQPDIRMLIVGCAPEMIPTSLRNRVHAVASLPFDNYIWLLRRSRFNVVPLNPVRHTCGLRVWFQSLAIGTPTIITATDACDHYHARGVPACMYPCGDQHTLAHQMGILWNNATHREELAQAGLYSVANGLSADAYHNRLLKFLERKLALPNDIEVV